MSQYTARVLWSRGDQVFSDRRYRRAHRLCFDGGVEFLGSASPQVVPPPYADPAGVDPEELFVASLAACHMLWFLDLACRAGWVVDDYDDEPVGLMSKDEHGRLAMSQVRLRPRVVFGGARQPDADALDALHHAAHEACFIANSVRTEVRIRPRA